jgi:uncharacterized protein YqfA (UPF0365 family)
MNFEQVLSDILCLGVLYGALLAVLLALLLAAMTCKALVIPWVRGLSGGVPVSIVQLARMRARGVPPQLVVDSLLKLAHRGYRYDPLMCFQAVNVYLAEEEGVRSSEQLADLTAKYLKSDGPT